MESSEKISGSKIYTILEQLKNDHTILNMHVMGTNFDGLTIILGLSESENPGFFIDYPGSAGVVAPIAEGKKCYFQFSDGERIKYSFKTTIKSILGRRIKFPFPEVIERTQRRNSFRAPVPQGVKLLYKFADTQLDFEIINISEGGILIQIDIKQYNKQFMVKGKRLSGLVLVYENEEMQINMKIGSVVIVRLLKDIDTDKIELGCKIFEIAKGDQNELMRFIYFCQRKVLKDRGGFDE
jgi:c-di-GMP-binding flagellar brake protein YcgR